jgi:hypothetical protein
MSNAPNGVITLGKLGDKVVDSTQWNKHCMKYIGRTVSFVLKSNAPPSAFAAVRLTHAEWGKLGFKFAACKDFVPNGK